VCTVDAKISVQKSEERNFFHSLYLGQPIPEIQFENKNDGLWVTGPHVCPFYLNNQRENELNKRKDSDGRIWHFMGDRIEIDSENSWWYQGRSQLLASDFLMEQKLYQLLGHDRAFIHRSENRLLLVGEDFSSRLQEIKTALPEIENVFETKIIRDNRHRARIDRKATLKKIK